MTSGVFDLVKVADIFVDRDNRQRRELEKVDELAESIQQNGLINPIVITRDFNLVAGERRLEAHRSLGFEQIAAQFVEDLDPVELQLIELEENVRRVDLSWQDHVNAVAQFHEVKSETEEEWTQEKTAEALNMSQSNVARQLLVKKGLDEGVKEIVEAPKLTVAANFAQRAQERKKTSLLRDLKQSTPDITLSSAESADAPAESSGEPDIYAEIINTDFVEWSKTVQDAPYNFIHCDFPYGINTGDTTGMSAKKSHGGYDDSEEVYLKLLDAFVTNQDRFVAPSAHLIFWFSMKYYQVTVDTFKSAGWVVLPQPLIWYKSDNTGILADPHRGPRNIYETALFCTRGDRKIVRAVGNVFPCPVPKKDDKIHMSQKPLPMLEHFFRMLVDESTLMLDPTCGSGNSVKAAESMGASWATGLEINPEFAADALANLNGLAGEIENNS